MARTNIYPHGKMKRKNVNLNPDYEKEMMQEVRKVIKPYHLLKGETETEYIQRIQSMHLEKCSNEALIDLKSKKK